MYSITFDADGGVPIPPKQAVEVGETAVVPVPNPTKQGYVFKFWSLSGENTAYNFQTAVNSNITLVAEWQAEATVEYWKVTWQLNGGAWTTGYTPSTQVVKGGTLSEPSEPTKAGSTFGGWYKEAALTNKVAFPYNVSSLTADFTLYAKWENENGGSTTSFTIRNTNDWNNAVSAIKSGGKDKSYTLVIEGTVSVPPTIGVEEKEPATYTFGAVDNLTVTLTGSGTLALSAKGFLVCLSGYRLLTKTTQKLIIDGPTLQGRSDNTVQLLRLEYADLELKDGKITGNTNNGGDGANDAGGVRIKSGIFNMSGGEISNNSCVQSYGGGVFLDCSTFNLSGGTISGNTSRLGGGVFVSGSSLEKNYFTMSGGEIKGNTAKSSSPYGGGVYVTQYGNFSKTGGSIYGIDAIDANKNKVTDNNGNVFNSNGTAVFFINSTSIPSTNNKRRETTLGENNNISTDDLNTGWGL